MQIKTINLTGEEIKVELERPYIFVEINNKNDSEILASINPNIVRGNDNVLIIKANSTGTLGDVGFPKIKEIYLSGSGKVGIIAKDFVTSSVNIYAKKGSGGGAGDIPSPEVLDFLPHPEGIYAFWDWEHGVTSGTWTDRVNSTVIEAINGNNFVVKNSCAQLENKNADNVYDAKLPIRNLNEATIYIVVDKNFVGNYLADSSKNNIYSNIISGYLRFFYRIDTQSSEFASMDYRQVGYIFIMRISQTNYIFSFMQNTADYKISKEYSLSRARFEFSGDFGLCDAVPIKALLISSDISNVDSINENAKALLDKYFPTQGGI